MQKFHSSSHKNRPPHLYLDETIYFITGRTLKNSIFNDNINKKIFLKILKEIIDELSIICYAYIILNNHYHILLKPLNGLSIPRFINRLHSLTSLHINKLQNRIGRKMWYQYWDRIPRNEDDFYAWFNYIHLNPVKHGYLNLNKTIFYKASGVLHINEDAISELIRLLKQYKFSSFNSHINSKSENWMKELWMNISLPLDIWNFEKN